MRPVLIALLMIVSPLPGCTSQALYLSAQQWQRNECGKLPSSEQERCLAGNAMSFEEYERQRALAQGR
jgi:hypothetical protein